MRVYVESNFVMELTRRQEQAASCEALLREARTKTIDLRIPSHALAEPVQTVHRSEANKKRVAKRMRRLQAEMARTGLFKAEASKLLDLDTMFVEAINTEESSLKSILLGVTNAALTLNTDSEAISVALGLPLRLNDAIIAGVILADLQRDPIKQSCFVTRDKKDFSNPELLGYFTANQCKVIFSFEQACGHLGIS